MDQLSSTTAGASTHPPLAPVVVFAYMRVDHLRRTVASLQANPEAVATDVVFYCDAAKRPEHQAAVQGVREFVETVTGFLSVTCVHRTQNMGLARSVVDGVSQALKNHGRVIVLEDDLFLSPHFLRFMNDGLIRYEHDERVASIHGYIYPVDEALPETFFLQGADCWGWATWARGWAHFEPDGTRLLTDLRTRGLNRHFDFDGHYPYTAMLEDQIAGRNNSWAILWHASCYLKGLLTLYPGRSLVENIGNDSSGTHCESTEAFSREPTRSRVQVGSIAVEASDAARDAVVRFFAARRSWKSKVRSSVKRLWERQP